MALYITFSLLGCLLIVFAIKGTEYQHKWFSIPAVAVKSRVYMFIAGALCFTVVGLVLNYDKADQTTETTKVEYREPGLSAPKTPTNSASHTMELYCCNVDTRAKICPIEIAIGAPGLPCYCVGSEGAGIICQ